MLVKVYSEFSLRRAKKSLHRNVFAHRPKALKATDQILCSQPAFPWKGNLESRGHGLQGPGVGAEIRKDLKVCNLVMDFA